MRRAATPGGRSGAGLAGLVVVTLSALLLAACGQPGSGATAAGRGGVPDPLVVGLVPNVAPDEQRARYEPFGEYLEETLGVEVELFVASNYAGVVTAMASDQLDLAYFGGVTYVQAEQQADVVPLVTEVDRETGTSKYVSAVIVRAGAGLSGLDDILATGGVFAMGDVASTSGSLYPRIMLVEAGAACTPVDLTDCDPLEVVFTGGHDAAVQAVLAQSAIAGGVERRILNRLIRDGAVDGDGLDIVAEREVEGYPWVARTALGEQAHDAIVDAFLAIDDPALLDLLRADGYVRVTAADYDEVRRSAGELGLLQAIEEQEE